MTTFIDLAKISINKLEKEVNTCNYYTPMSIVASTKFLDDSYHDAEINYEEYDKHKKKIDNLANKFSENCICLNKNRIDTELRKVLTKYGYLKI